MSNKNDPERKSPFTIRYEIIICLKCQKPFKSPDKTRVRTCNNCQDVNRYIRTMYQISTQE